MLGKSRLSSATSVCDNLRKFQNWFLNSGVLSTGVVVTELYKLKVRARLEIHTIFFSNYLYFSFVRPNGFQLYSDIVL